jgi:hypothetical protein
MMIVNFLSIQSMSFRINGSDEKGNPQVHMAPGEAFEGFCGAVTNDIGSQIKVLGKTYEAK